MPTSHDPSTNGEPPFDFIIAGAGASGAVVASRLSEDPKFRVLLLEAGGEPPPESHIPAACASMQGKPDADWRFVDSGSPGTALGLVDRRMRLPRGKMLGGSTSMNFQIYVRGHPADFDRWEESGANGWGWKDVLPYFRRSEAVMKDNMPDDGLCHLEGDDHGTDGPWPVSFRDPTLPSTAAFVEGCGRLGYTVGDYNGTRARTSSASKGVVGTHQFTIRDGKRASTYTSFLEPIRESRPNLTIVTGATVDRVAISDGRAVGVHYVTSSSSGKESVHYAAASREVVLSCGAYQSPQVLLRSGVGPRDDLEALGVDCVVDSPHVGRHLKDHLTLIVPFACENGTSVGTLLSSLGMTDDKSTFEEYTSTGKGLPSSSLCDASVFYNTGVHPDNARTHDAQISSFVTGMVPELMERCLGVEDVRGILHDEQFDLERSFAVLCPIMLQPVSEGVVRLPKDEPGDPLAAPVIEHRYLEEEVDLRMLVSMCKEAVAIKDAMGESTEVGDVLVPKNVAARHGTDLSKDELWEDWIRHYANTCYHPTSTCRIGDVVDEACGVVGVDGLRVADASVMPDIVSGNTQAACVMIGEKVADAIASDHGMTLSCC